MKNPAAQELGKLGGKVKSARKARAARKNGKKGGRPKKPLKTASALKGWGPDAHSTGVPSL